MSSNRQVEGSKIRLEDLVAASAASRASEASKISLSRDKEEEEDGKKASVTFLMNLRSSLAVEGKEGSVDKEGASVRNRVKM